MSWAFWRDQNKAEAAKPVADDAVDSARVDQAAHLRRRTRRRLIGAAALLLAAVIVLPLVLDPSPRPLPDSVAIDIPGDKTPFVPRLSQPAPAAAPAPPAKPAAPAKQSEPSAPAVATVAVPDKSAPVNVSPPASAPASTPVGAQFVLQAAALASESAARDLVARLKKAGFAPYTEKISTQNGDRIRVRLGPFATREDAEQARAKLKALGIQAGVVSG